MIKVLFIYPSINWGNKEIFSAFAPPMGALYLASVLENSNLDVDVTGTFDMLSTGAFSIDGTGASNVSATSGNLTLSTITSGYLDIISAQAAGQTTTEAVSISATNDLGGADELMQVSDSGGDLFTCCERPCDRSALVEGVDKPVVATNIYCVVGTDSRA